MEANSVQNQFSPSNIPVQRDKSVFGDTSTGSKRDSKAFSLIEKQMEEEMGKVLHEWDENIERKSFQLRPLLPREVERARFPRHSTLKLSSTQPQTNGKVVDQREGQGTDPQVSHRYVERGTHPWSHSETGKGDSIPSPLASPSSPRLHRSYESREGLLDTSAESLEDDGKHPLYVMSPETGRRIFRLEFDVQGFDTDDIRVKVAGQKLVIFAVHRESQSGRKSTSEFCRKLKIPQDVDLDNMACTYIEGNLVIEAPLLALTKTSRNSSRIRLSSTSSDMGCSLRPLGDLPINVPQITGKMLNLLIEVGPLFKSDDIIVKLKGSNQLSVEAVRQEHNVHGSMAATLSRTFNMPDCVEPKSLRAGLSGTGILKVVAEIRTKQNGAEISDNS